MTRAFAAAPARPGGRRAWRAVSGSASTNPIMFTFAVGLMLAWSAAGYAEDQPLGLRVGS